MYTLDISPLFRSGIGFDRLGAMFENASRFAANEYPPYDVEKLGEDAYRITMAVAGFPQECIDISVERNILTVRGNKPKNEQGKSESRHLHRGIAARSFQSRFMLTDHVVVREASLDNGLLKIDLAVEIPEALKPRRVEINDRPQGQVAQAKIEEAA